MANNELVDGWAETPTASEPEGYLSKFQRHFTGWANGLKFISYLHKEGTKAKVSTREPKSYENHKDIVAEQIKAR